ncbi:hypothetical protein VTP01DRAFT_4737 [Rhizomucor pusillus]|uniref:uncharacterized protein n=1 Tax=Rhizomucor pusillus TaxID=4840 RepID=UPI00374267E2
MTTVRVDNYKTYWHEGPLGSLLLMDFRHYMTRQRCEEGPFYQLWDFIKAYNDHLADALIPGRYLCDDEIGQEYNTLADATTNCIIRVDVNGDTGPQGFDDVFSMKTVASVARLTKP